MLEEVVGLAKEVQQVLAGLGVVALGERPVLVMVFPVQLTQAGVVEELETLITVGLVDLGLLSLKSRAAVLRLFQRELRSLLQHPVVLIFTP
jgi:hypothetical protein